MPKRANLARDDQRALAVLADIGRALARGGEVRSVLERGLELLEEGVGIVRGAVFLFHEESGALQVEAAVGISDEGLGARYRPGRGSSAASCSPGGRWWCPRAPGSPCSSTGPSSGGGLAHPR